MSVPQKDLSERAPWLRTAVLGATDGLITLSCFMIASVGNDAIAIRTLVGFSGLLAGALSMATREFISVSYQVEVERNGNGDQGRKQFPSPWKASLASGIAFSVGAILPVLAGCFLVDINLRFGLLVGVTTFMLLVFGWASAVLGNTNRWRSCLRLLIGGLLSMAVGFGVPHLVSSILWV